MKISKKPYKNLLVWQRSYSFILGVYQVTKDFPSEEKYGVTSQLRRAAVSVSNNIVEGGAKRSAKDFVRFLYIAKGSLTECEFLLELARDLQYLGTIDYDRLEDLRRQTSILLNRLINSLSQV